MRSAAATHARTEPAVRLGLRDNAAQFTLLVPNPTHGLHTVVLPLVVPANGAAAQP